jgi:hypothetical protein
MRPVGWGVVNVIPNYIAACPEASTSMTRALVLCATTPRITPG